MRTSTLALSLVLAFTVFAGCITDPPQADGDTPATSTFDFATAAWPTGQTAYDYIDSYIMDHPFRLNSPATESFMATARDSLQTIMEGYNATVERHDYGTGVNMLGFHYGTENPEQWVVLSAHYDTTESTLYGAWDDGAGVASLIALAAVLKDWELPFTVVYAFFDEEEQGLVGSRHFVADHNERDDIELVANINMDPPGLNWPCGDVLGHFPVKIIHNQEKIDQVVSERYVWLFDALEAGLAHAEVPDEVRDYTPGIPIAVVNFPVEVPEVGDSFGVTGTSDHANFDRVDIANVFLGGTPTSHIGPVSALTYGLHTPIDTLQQMDARCTGGDGTLADGLHTIVTTVAGTLQYMTENGIPEY